MSLLWKCKFLRRDCHKLMASVWIFKQTETTLSSYLLHTFAPCQVDTHHLTNFCPFTFLSRFNLSGQDDEDEDEDDDGSESDLEANSKPTFSSITKSSGFLDKELAASGFTRRGQDDIEKVQIFCMKYLWFALVEDRLSILVVNLAADSWYL